MPRKRFCLCSLCSHPNVLSFFPPCPGDAQKVWMRPDFSLNSMFSQHVDQRGSSVVGNPARGQLNRENDSFPVPARA